MNTKVKVGIAAAIVAALVALIVLDQKTSPKDDTAVKPGSNDNSITVIGTGADAPAPRLGDAEINALLENAKKQFSEKPGSKQPATGNLKGTEERNEKKIPSATGEEYVIKEGDSFDSIAKAKYGNASFAGMIAEANPGLKATSLRVGKKIVLPPKTEKKVEEPVVAKTVEKTEEPPVITKKPEPAAALAVVDGKKVYTVQAGDTLSGISSKVYNTSRHYQKIYEANKDVIEDPNTLQVGAKLVMPDLPGKPASANGSGAGAVATTNPAPPPAGAKMVQVPDGGSLWKIAEKFAPTKKVSIYEMMKLIIAANPDKLKDENTILSKGWQLIIPE